MVAPDATTLAYLRGRAYAPDGADFDAAEAWLALASDADAVFDREVVLDGAQIAPVVTWGTSPEDALPITGTVPDPDHRPMPPAPPTSAMPWPIWICGRGRSCPSAD